MNKDQFNELLESIRQGGAILRGEAKPSRIFTVERPKFSAKKKLKAPKRPSNPTPACFSMLF